MVMILMLSRFRQACCFVCDTPPGLETTVVSVADALAGAHMSMHVVMQLTVTSSVLQQHTHACTAPPSREQRQSTYEKGCTIAST